jgi:DNA polymerase I-like protein with 3'-5' exonuclease and polymerase domains
VEQAVDTKRQVTPWGLTYYWPFAKRSSNGSVNCETQCDNYPIQALATAEIVPIAAVYLWHRIAEFDLRARMVNMVHDSVPCEVHPDDVADFTEQVKAAFTQDVYEYLRRVYGMDFEQVPLGVGLKIGPNWGTGPEQSWDIYSNGTERQRK